MSKKNKRGLKNGGKMNRIKTNPCCFREKDKVLKKYAMNNELKMVRKLLKEYEYRECILKRVIDKCIELDRVKIIEAINKTIKEN